MKSFLIFGAATLLVAGVAASLSAGEVVGAVPATTLSSMGFGGVQLMSDADGLAVRGKGTYANVWGNSSATYYGRNGTSSAYNEYGAGANHKYGGSSAGGGSDTFAGVAVTRGRHSASFQIISGGSASSYAR